MKYGRPVDYSQNGSDIRMMDVVEAPSPLPNWAATDAAWLAKQFPTLSGFKAVPAGVQPCAKFSGNVNVPADFNDPMNYVNWDGSFGDGSFPEEP